jgi:hypothetical protein
MSARVWGCGCLRRRAHQTIEAPPRHRGGLSPCSQTPSQEPKCLVWVRAVEPQPPCLLLTCTKLGPGSHPPPPVTRTHSHSHFASLVSPFLAPACGTAYLLRPESTEEVLARLGHREKAGYDDVLVDVHCTDGSTVCHCCRTSITAA